ncbi:MAG TPA: glucosamine-6-phosphate deaminase [Clostridia bacterium]|nr:glucosamine-6-phosphate deaminase [Clostridia bacterium]
MRIVVSPDAKRLGQCAAEQVANILRACIAEQGYARIVLSTGASQLTTLEALVQLDVDWQRVEMFHLDEYAGLPETHPASFRKYLRERFLQRVPVGKAHLVDGSAEGIAALTRDLRERPVDLGLIGIGENAHIAFNDPPADFDTREAYIFVNLDPACKRQQVGEGWFASVEDVPNQAVSMTVHQILQCKRIVSCVPFAVKASAVRDALHAPVSNLVPATVLRGHPDFALFVDADSFVLADASRLASQGIRIERVE